MKYNVIGVYPNGIPETIYRNIADKKVAENLAQEVRDNFGGSWKLKVVEVK